VARRNGNDQVVVAVEVVAAVEEEDTGTIILKTSLPHLLPVP